MRVALVLVGVGTLAVMELETPPRTTKPMNEPPAQGTVGLRASHDTLTTIDQLELRNMQFEAPPQSAFSSDLTPPPAQTAIVTQEPSKNIKHKRSARGGKSACMLPGPRPEQGTSKTTAKAYRAKPVAEVKLPVDQVSSMAYSEH